MENFLSRQESDRSLRPKNFDTYIGQKKIIDRMKVYVQAATSRQEPLDHVLLFGPPGLGKTTLAHVLAREMNVNLHITSGPVIDKSGDLAAILTQLQPGDILFIDEIHRLSSSIEEILYPAMEDYQLDFMVGEGPGARSMRIDLHPFCLIAATTKPGVLTAPLRDRFGIHARMEYYEGIDIKKILFQASSKFSIDISEEACDQIALRARGTPRVALRLLRRVRDYLEVHAGQNTEVELVKKGLQALEIDTCGLDYLDRTVLTCIRDRFKGGPVGLETLATALGESKDTLEDIVEPYLVQENFLQRTPRGRKITEKGLAHLNEQG